MSRRRRRPRKTPQHAGGADRLVNIEINGILDLHHFKPSDVPELVEDYLQECRRQNISEIRIIHGKGKGVLRAIVQDILARDPYVVAYGAANDRSGWGATVAQLRTSPNKTVKPKKAEEKERLHSLSPARSFLRRLWPFGGREKP